MPKLSRPAMIIVILVALAGSAAAAAFISPVLAKLFISPEQRKADLKACYDRAYRHFGLRTDNVMAKHAFETCDDECKDGMSIRTASSMNDLERVMDCSSVGTSWLLETIHREDEIRAQMKRDLPPEVFDKYVK